MRRLMLLRHAKTETNAASGRDIDRKLDERGTVDAAEIGQWLSQQPALPSRVLVSPAVRARETWNIVAKSVSPAPDTREVEELYASSVSQLLAAIHEQGGDAATLMLVAHNPGLHELAISLSERNTSEPMRALQDNLPTGAVAVIDFPVEDWRDIHLQSGRLADLVSPKTLRIASREPS
jgi:phosphohistidine phosphatase